MDRKSPDSQDAANGKGKGKWSKPPKLTPKARRQAKALKYMTGPMGPAQAMSVSKLSKEAKQLLQRMAHNGVKEVAIRPRGPERGDVAIDGSTVEDLTPLLYYLVKILAKKKKSNDEFNGFRTYEDVGMQLSKRFGGGFTEHAVSNLLTRLKNEFLQHNTNPFVIENERPYARLRLQRPNSRHVA